MRMPEASSTDLSSKTLKKYSVLAQIPWRVTKVDSIESACNIAVAELSKRLPHYVNLDVPLIRCRCGKTQKAAYLSVDEALVTVVAEMKVVADSEAGAKRVAASVLRKSLGKRSFRITEAEGT